MKKEDLMKLIVGLGNPGKEYERTRHNAGFMVIDKVAEKCSLSFNKTKFNALVAEGKVHGESVMLMKPQTYMNLSGNAVSEAVRFYKLDLSDLLIIHDDLDLPVGKIRIRESGSAGGQNGMKNIINLLGTQDIRRIRVGIDKNKLIPVPDYVLGKIPEEQKDEFDQAVETAAKAAVASITMSFSNVMNRYNGAKR